MQRHKTYLRFVSDDYSKYILYFKHYRSIHDPPGQVIKCVLECYEVSRENLTYDFEHIVLIERDQMRIYIRALGFIYIP